jgi:integrase
MAKHSILGGKVHVYQRENSTHWQCSTYLGGRNHRVTTKTDSLSEAKDIAEDWYLGLRGKLRNGELPVGRKKEKTFREAAAVFERDYAILTEGERSPRYVQLQRDRIRVHLNPFFGDLGLSEVTEAKVHEYRVHRATTPTVRKATASKMRVRGSIPIDDLSAKKPSPPHKPPARTTVHQEIVILRHILKAAKTQGWLKYLPDLSAPYKKSMKVSHRAWFSPPEYTKLYEATRERARAPKKARWKWVSEQMHDYVLFVANTGLRPDEAARLEFRDVEIVKDAATGKIILDIEVRGKRGVGYCKSTFKAVTPFRRLRDRLRPIEGGRKTTSARPPDDEAKQGGQAPKTEVKATQRKPQATDHVFPGEMRHLLNQILDELELKFDREGQRRTAYSLRHTYICFRLLEGADIYQIAKNCRTSVEMIEKFYASHIKNMLDAAAINVMRPRLRKSDSPTASQ